MGRKEKQKAKKIEHEEDAANDKSASTSLLVASSDDEEANEDLSLKIVEKALRMRAAHPKLLPNDVLRDGDVGASSSQQNELAVARYDDLLDGPRGIAASEVDGEQIQNERKRKKKKKKKKKVESRDQSAVIAEEQETVETIKAAEKNESAEASAVQISDNIVLRKLLRGPRYFDPPDCGWGTCYNCGEEGHAAVNCTAAKRKKPCFVCGSLGHSAKQCTMARDCFICKKGGHRAKDCPEKHMGGSKSSTVCLKCGNSGHEMFSCKDDYSLDDLKEMQCYVCKRFGHLCCVNTANDATPIEISCYKCGQLGHTGLACSRLRSEATGAATPSSCYKCGEEGHFARECTSSVKVGKRKHELSNTKTSKFEKEIGFMEYRSAPHDMGKARKKKRPLTEERGMTAPQKSKHKGGWMTEHPGEFSLSKSKRNSCRSPVTPSTKSIKIHSFSSGSHTPSSKSSKMWKAHDGTPNSRGSAKTFHHRFSASRFGNSGSDGLGRSYNWW